MIPKRSQKSGSHTGGRIISSRFVITDVFCSHYCSLTVARRYFCSFKLAMGS